MAKRARDSQADPSVDCPTPAEFAVVRDHMLAQERYLLGLVERLQRRGYLATKHRFMADVEAAMLAVRRVRERLTSASEGVIGKSGADDTTR